MQRIRSCFSLFLSLLRNIDPAERAHNYDGFMALDLVLFSLVRLTPFTSVDCTGTEMRGGRREGRSRCFFLVSALFRDDDSSNIKLGDLLSFHLFIYFSQMSRVTAERQGRVPPNGTTSWTLQKLEASSNSSSLLLFSSRWLVTALERSFTRALHSVTRSSTALTPTKGAKSTRIWSRLVEVLLAYLLV